MADKTVKAAPTTSGSSGGARDPGIGAGQDFLVRFGYLAAGRFEPGRLDDETASALGRYQERAGLRVSGAFDASTRRRMSTPRCAMADLDGRVEFALACTWIHPCLTYAFETGTADVPGTAEFQAVRDALATWAVVAPLTFTEVARHQHPDIVIGWRPAPDTDFDLEDAMAHADFPPGCGVISDTLPKPLHFNDVGTNWAIGKTIFSFDVQSVAVHELGHLLGLQHSDVEDAVMFPVLSFNATRQALTDDDVAGIRQLYPAAIPGAGLVTIRQASSGRFLDAHEIAEADFRLVTRPAQDNDTQRWVLTPVGTVNVIRHRTSGRFLDAFETEGEDFRVVTRDPKAGSASQRWIVVAGIDGSVTVRQLSGNRFLDAHEIAEWDFAAVTRHAQADETQRWVPTAVGPHTFTLRQRSAGRFLDAHEIAERDFAVVTRPAQQDQTQHWIFAPVGTVVTLRQRSNGRFVDAHEIAAKDFAVVARPAQGDDTQRWIVVPSSEGTCTVRQLSTARFLDAHGGPDHDFGVVTRPRRDTRAQRWFIEPV